MPRQEKIAKFESKHFSLQSLTEGVFAAIASDAGAAIGNAGLVELGGEVIVFGPIWYAGHGRKLLR